MQATDPSSGGRRIYVPGIIPFNMKLVFFRFAKAFGGIIAGFSTFLVVFVPKGASIKLGYVILTGILGLLGLYIFIRSDRKVKELEKSAESAGKKIKHGIIEAMLITAFILLVLVLLALIIMVMRHH